MIVGRGACFSHTLAAIEQKVRTEEMNKIYILPFCFCIAFNGCVVFHTKPSVEYLTLAKGRYSLFFYGAVHSNSVNDPMFDDIEKQFKMCSPKFVLVEGGYNLGSYKTREEAISEGEAAFVVYISTQKGIPVENIEPSEDYVVGELLKKYSGGSILTMYVLRQIFQMQREAGYKDVDFEHYMLRFVGTYKKYGLTRPTIDSFSNLHELLKHECNIELTLDNWKDVNVYDFVYKEEGQINQIYREVLTMRDEYAADLIIRKLKEHERVFVIMGGDHIRNQEEKLRKEFNKLNGG